ncbi:MAG: S8 family serine peptidase [Candidatus Schekmanbacteria bacterium]|nr:S8 family serine peptidase [Candidatus Schekmanbacteria bacterium]
MRLIRGCLILTLVLRLPALSWAVGAVTAEVDQTLGLAALRQQTGLTGAGVTIGIVGEGAHDWRNYVASGDLPSDIQFVEGDEGSGLSLGHLQVIHDVAPGAKLLFNKYGGGPPDQSAQELMNLGANIIFFMDDQMFGGLVFEEKWLTDAITASQSGTLIISPADDYGSAHYRGEFVDSGNGEHDFGGGNTVMTVNVPADCEALPTIAWSEPQASDFSDYRIRFYDQAHNPLGQLYSDGVKPMATGFLEPTSYDRQEWISVWKAPEAPALLFDIRFDCYFPGPVGGISATIEPGLRVDEGSIVGVAALPEVLTVGALDQTTEVAPGRYAVRPYSGRGPAEITIPTTEVRPKPDLMAPDCQSRYVIPYEGTPYTLSQCGTSISAAVVTGIAALVQEKQGFVRTADIKALLTGTAADLEEPGFDGVSGYGQVDPAAALALPKVPTSALVLLLAITCIICKRRR